MANCQSVNGCDKKAPAEASALSGAYLSLLTAGLRFLNGRKIANEKVPVERILYDQKCRPTATSLPHMELEIAYEAGYLTVQKTQANSDFIFMSASRPSYQLA